VDQSLVALVSRFQPLRKNGNECIGPCCFCGSAAEDSLKVGDVAWRTICCCAQEENGSDRIGWLMSWSGCTREEAAAKLGNGGLPESIPVRIPALRTLPFWGAPWLDKLPGARVWIHERPEGVHGGREFYPERVHLGIVTDPVWGNLSQVKERECILLPINLEASFERMDALAARLYAAGHSKVKYIDVHDQEDMWSWPGQLDKEQARAFAVAHAEPYPNTVLSTPNAPERAQSVSASPPHQASETPPIVKPSLRVVDGNALRAPKLENANDPEQLPAFSEFALARAFADGPGVDWRYTAAWGLWAKWDGMRWVQDERKGITWEAKNCCSAVMQEHLSDSTPAQRLKVGTLRTVNAVIGLAGSDPRVAAAAMAWDASPYLLGTPAGVVDLLTGAISPATKDQLISKSTCIAPLAGQHPWWDRVIARPQGGAMVEFLQLWCGYALTGDTREERFLFIHGPGGGGKSKFLNVISEIFGDYRRTAPMDAFTVRQHHEHSEEIARLAGARLVVATETDEGSRWNEARIKQLTGRDFITARHMRMSSFEFAPQFKLVFIGNHKPALRSVGEEMRRRIDLIDWGGTIPESERILDLPDKLRTEYPAILAWMIEGCIKWQRQGLGKPPAVAASVADYIQGEDTLGAWMEECVELREGERVRSGDAYHSFRRWADAQGEFIPSQKRFTQRLRDRGIESIKSGSRYFQGIRLRVTDAEVRETVGWVPD